ncbi:glycosyl hydrolase family 2 sugar binding domain protein [Ruminococcus sp. CAG:579]|nr:glycosyl hydrolase family 2 sugar binding domain protein [Ruminococcus sp. CAG:579]
MKITQNLDNNWTMRTEKYGTLPCKVPCSLYSVLLDNKKIPDPCYRENEYISTPLSDMDCEFSTEFECSNELLAADRKILSFGGIDTISEIFVNGVKVGESDNMHCALKIDISGVIKKNNMITVKITSPTKIIAQMQQNRPLWGVASTMAGYPHMRKAHCMFGWDWGPKLPDMGIWRSVELTAVNGALITDTRISQRHSENFVNVDIFVNSDFEFGRCKVTITSPDRETFTAESNANAASASVSIGISNPQIWWANGLGKQPLYNVVTEIFDKNGVKTDEKRERIGLRTLIISRDKDEWGEEFCFKLNGEKVFAMGANYIPEDQLIAQRSEKRTRRLLEDCAAANYNTIRVWGGGFYPDDWFYDICDELGLIVWQDFMFACSAYLLTKTFEKSVREEVRQNVLRLRNHASLGLWCGNNEIESAWEGWGLPDDPQAKADYLTIFEEIIPQILAETDPETSYHPSSPSSGGGFKQSSSNHAGDMHYWDIWHNLKPIEDFRKYYYRFCSEYGFESVPALKTMLTIADPVRGDLDLMSPVMEAHQKCVQGNEKLMFYLAQMVRYPYDFAQLIYSSQLLQADCIRSSVEHMRRARGRCMGSLYWQVNDSNPVISWSSVDYFGRWKALHYYAKRFYAPVLLSLNDSDISALKFNISNETLSSVSGEVYWDLRDNKSEILDSGHFAANVNAMSACDFAPVNLSKLLSTEHDKRTRYIEYRLEIGGKTISRGSTLFTRPKTFEFIRPNIEISAKDISDSWEIALKSDVFTKSVCLDLTDRDAVFDDNWFDIHGDEVRVNLCKSRVSAPFASADEFLEKLTVRSCFFELK